MTKQIHQSTLRETAVPGGRRLELEFRSGGDPSIPGVLLLPAAAGREAGAPAAILLHGYSSRKEHMSDGVGRVLLEHGIATLSVDLPLHGSRRDPVQAQAVRNPLRVLSTWRLAVRETRLAFHLLRLRPEIDGGRVAVIGYSLGSYLGTLLAADEPRVRAVVVAAGGDLPADTPFTALARGVADPLRAVRRLGGRPLLVVHGRHDRTARPEQAERLFAAAAEPKELRWWDAGHRLPDAAIHDAAGWLLRHLGAP